MMLALNPKEESCDMNVFKVSAFCVLAGAMVACTGNDTGTLVTPDPVAGFRYVNLVADTGSMDFRIIDVVTNAPNQVDAAFRTGGSPAGTTPNGFLPPYQGVLADGTPRHIRVFMTGTTAAIASTVMFDTTFNFTPGSNYTMFLYGYARTGQGGIRAVITTDAPTAPAAGKFSLRLLNLAQDLTGNPGGVALASGYHVDGRVALTTSAVPAPGAASFVNSAFGDLSSYVSFDTSSSTTAAATTVYRIVLTSNGLTTPVAFQVQLPTGLRGSSTANPIAGSGVVGTSMTAVLVPRSIAGSAAPQAAAAAVSANIDSLTRSNDTVTVWRRITPGNGTTTCNSAVAAGVAANDILNVSGVTQPEYNGSQAVINIVAGASQVVDTARQTVTLTGATAGSTFRLTFSGQQTSVLSYDESPATVQAALGALSTIGGIANVNVTGPAGGPWVVVFRGTFLGTNPVALMTVTTTGTATGAVANNFTCRGTATSSRFRYRIAGLPAPLATGAPAYRIVTAGAAVDFTIPSIVFLIDRQADRTAP
jgi:hypothetical protein